MKYSKEQLRKLADDTGFRAEILEKVLLLMDLMTAFSADPTLKNKIVLKGGTALNLFYMELPRLSVDIDLNYIGEIRREKMLRDRQIIEERIIAICELQGFTVYRKPTLHAGGKIIWRYPSALGNMGNLEMDLNFMYRVPLLPVSYENSWPVGENLIEKIPVLDIHELAAGKFSALIDRTLGRDLFDVYNLLIMKSLDFEKLRLIFTIYAGMGRKKILGQSSQSRLPLILKNYRIGYCHYYLNKFLEVLKTNRNGRAACYFLCRLRLHKLFPLR